MLKIADFYQII